MNAAIRRGVVWELAEACFNDCCVSFMPRHLYERLARWRQWPKAQAYNEGDVPSFLSATSTLPMKQNRN